MVKILLLFFFSMGLMIDSVSAQFVRQLITGKETVINFQSLGLDEKDRNAGDPNLDKRLKLLVHVGNVGELFFSPSLKTNTIYPKIYYSSNYYSSTFLGGKIGTGVAFGLNYLLPFATFSPKFRYNNFHLGIDLGMQIVVGWGMGFVPFGGIKTGYSYPFSDKLALSAEIGVNSAINFYTNPTIFPYANIGLIRIIKSGLKN